MPTWLYQLTLITPAMWLAIFAVVGFASFFIMAGTSLWRQRVYRPLVWGCFAALVAVMLAAGIGAWGNVRLTRAATGATTGTVVAVHHAVESGRSHRRYTTLTYTYAVAGVGYRGDTRVNGWRYAESDTLCVRYIPHRPTQVVVPRDIYWPVLGFLVGGGALLLGLGGCWVLLRHPEVLGPSSTKTKTRH